MIRKTFKTSSVDIYPVKLKKLYGASFFYYIIALYKTQKYKNTKTLPS